eukprot:m.586873 g.586873  ORF g.586873 m.586873 type:complete len:171 (+) comp22348_c0_seq1:2-514(+)
MFDMNMRPDKTGCPGRTYRFYTGTPVFKFGEGLSYTSFAYSFAAPTAAVPTLSAEELSKDIALTQHRPHTAAPILRVVVDVHNTGSASGAETILAYVRPPVEAVRGAGAPLRALRRYEKVLLHPGEATRTTIEFSAPDFALADPRTGALSTSSGVWRLDIGTLQTNVTIA